MRRRHGGWLRGLSGTLAGGLVVLLAGLGAAGFVATRVGTAGPGPATLVWHGVAAVLAVTAQVYADRHAGPRGAVAALGIVGLTAVVLAALWLA